VRRVAELPDPVGEEFERQTLPNGLQIRKRRVPLGVLGVIYEARPNVTVDVAALALKTSNAVILRGGSETLRSNIALVDAIQIGLRSAGFPADAVQLIRDTDRQYVRELLRLSEFVDMIIPRGGNALHTFLPRKQHDPRHHGRDRHLSPVCGRHRRSGCGTWNCPERESAAPLGLQRARYAAGAGIDCRAVRAPGG
jgi:glutamate-5-semialdehyde dehydrogenase